MKKAKRRKVKRFAWEMGIKSVEREWERFQKKARGRGAYDRGVGGSDRNNKYSV